MKILAVLLLSLVVTSCTIHTSTPRVHNHKKRVCTREYYDKNYHCKHNPGKHKGHHKH